MKVFLKNQTKHFSKHLKFLKKEPTINYSESLLTEKISIANIETNLSFKSLNTEFIFAYKIFPSNIMTYLTEWEFEKREMRVGDTVVQQVFIPPIPKLSQKIIFGVRIKEVIREVDRVGFSYETLKGHVEMGVSTFTLEKEGNGTLIFKIHTFSKPGNLLSKLVGPLFSVPYQTFCTRQALLHVRGQLERV